MTAEEKKQHNLIAVRKYRLKNPDKVSAVLKKWVEHNPGYRSPSHKRARDIKEASPCLDCHQYYPAYVMHFDHRPGTVKVGEVGRMVHTGKWADVVKEIDKCDIVCANCHAIRTHVRIQYKEYLQEVS